MATDDAIARIADPEDVFRLREDSGNPWEAKSCFWNLPAFDGGVRREDRFQESEQQRLELFGNFAIEGFRPVPIQTAVPFDVFGKNAACIVHVLRGDEIPRTVEWLSHEDAAGGQRIGDGACSGMAAADDGDECHDVKRWWRAGNWIQNSMTN